MPDDYHDDELTNEVDDFEEEHVQPEEVDDICADPDEPRADKIFNNSYTHGDALKGDKYEFNVKIRVDDNYALSFMNDIYQAEDGISFKMVQDEIIRLLDTNAELNEMLDSAKKKKFNKSKINKLFKFIYDHFENKPEVKSFSNSIYIFDHISNISGLKYKNLFDLLDYEYKKILILELDKQYNILKNSANFNKMF